MKTINKKAVFAVLIVVLLISFASLFGAYYDGAREVFLFENSATQTAKTDKLNKQVYLGGMPIGIELKVSGVIVQGILPVVTADGVQVPLEGVDVKKGDILTAINENEVRNLQDISKVMSLIKTPLVTLDLMRQGKSFEVESLAVIDSISGQYRLGMSVLESVDGIGTLTFVDPQDGRFGALGHSITDNSEKQTYSNVCGNICGANIFSVYKGSRNQAGELVGNLVKSSKLGDIDKNETQGIFGEYKGDTSILKKINIASGKKVKPGKAYIVSSAFTGKPIYYEIEIIKACKQEKDKPKGMLFRVIDNRLIKISGGIVQGMSGSPIVQKGKLVGAVTHVFLADSTKGYGTFIDWMINK